MSSKYTYTKEKVEWYKRKEHYMSTRTLTQEDKMKLWYKGTRKLNISACSDSKLVDNYRICCEAGYFVQAATIRKELYYRGLNNNNIFKLQPEELPTDYYVTHTTEEIMSDLIKYINNYVTSSGDSVDNSRLKLNGEDYKKNPADGSKIYYGWSEGVPDLIIDTYKGTALFTGHPEIDCTKNLELVLKLLREELFYDL